MKSLPPHFFMLTLAALMIMNCCSSSVSAESALNLSDENTYSKHPGVTAAIDLSVLD